MELDGEGKRRRDGWRFDRFEVSGEDGGGEVAGVGGTVKAMLGQLGVSVCEMRSEGLGV